jgi:hypothetical protein
MHVLFSVYDFSLVKRINLYFFSLLSVKEKNNNQSLKKNICSKLFLTLLVLFFKQNFWINIFG